MRRTYTTQWVADSIGVNKRTLLQWLYDGKIREPRRVKFDHSNYRVWSQRDVEAARKYKERFYMKGRGRKKQQKQ